MHSSYLISAFKGFVTYQQLGQIRDHSLLCVDEETYFSLMHGCADWDENDWYAKFTLHDVTGIILPRNRFALTPSWAVAGQVMHWAFFEEL